MREMRTAMVPALEAGGVDLVLCGTVMLMSARTSWMDITAVQPRSKTIKT